ncbi:MAG: hypothetical protein WCI74_13950, partial [Actinomycetes bacterium]
MDVEGPESGTVEVEPITESEEALGMRLGRILTVTCIAALSVALFAAPAPAADASPGSGHLTNRLTAIAADQPKSSASLSSAAADDSDAEL